jgi:hypothetical protein
VAQFLSQLHPVLNAAFFIPGVYIMIKIKLDEIRIDGGTQQRCEINQDIVSEYAEAITEGIEFPAVTLFLDGVDYWLADGFHRVLAHQRVKSVDIHAEVIKGNQRDALLYSTGANNTHGLRVTNADKRKSVMVLLSDHEWSQWSNRQIAKHCRVGDHLVAELRNIRVRENALSEKKVDNSRPVEEKSNIFTENSVDSNILSSVDNNKNNFVGSVKQPDVEVKQNKNDDIQDNDDVKTLMFELTEIKKENIELTKENESLKEKLSMLESIVNSDNKLQAVLDEYKKLDDRHYSQAIILNNLQVDLNEIKRSYSYWKKEAGKLKFQLDKIKREAV